MFSEKFQNTLFLIDFVKTILIIKNIIVYINEFVSVQSSPACFNLQRQNV